MAAHHSKLFVDDLVCTQQMSAPTLKVDSIVYNQQMSVPTGTLVEAAALAATYTIGALLVVTDATPPALCWFNGTNWIATDDGTVVA